VIADALLGLKEMIHDGHSEGGSFETLRERSGMMMMLLRGRREGKVQPLCMGQERWK
jgi:hypothetical protein